MGGKQNPEYNTSRGGKNMYAAHLKHYMMTLQLPNLTHMILEG